MFNLETEIDSIDGMIREKEYMSNVSDIGRDLEHCKELQLKLSEVNTNMTINQVVWTFSVFINIMWMFLNPT